MTRKERGKLGVALMFSAFMLVIIFIITCCKKKNLLAALAAVAALDAAGGYFFLRRAAKRRNDYAFDILDDDYEIFNESEADRANRIIRAGIRKKHETDLHTVSRPVYEIPVDDELTEDDFVK